MITLDKEIYKPKEVAELLGVSVRTVQRWDNEHTIFKRTETDRRYMIKETLIQLLKDNDRYDTIFPNKDIDYSQHDVIFTSNTNMILSILNDYENLVNLKTIQNTPEIDSKAFEMLVGIIMDNKVNRLFIDKLELSDDKLDVIKIMCQHNNIELIIK